MDGTRRSRDPAPERGSRVASVAGARLPAAVVNLPSRLVVVFFWLTVVAALAVLVGAFTPAVVVAATAVAVGGTWRMVPQPLPVDRATLRGAVAALAMVAAWVLVNLPFASEVLLVQRDAGFLTLQGLWLSEHADPSIPLRTATQVAAQVPGAQAVSDAFWQDGADMYSQGASGFPGLLGVGGWVAGLDGVLVANIVIGGLALLAVYDVARRLIGPLWGLLPVAALALTTPFGYFTRTPFTEPTTTVLAFGGLAVLWGAFRRPSVWRFGLAGGMVGACALSRIDGAAVAAGLVLAVGAGAAGHRDPDRRRALRRGLVAAAAASCGMVLLGYLDLHVNSHGYLANHASMYRQLIGLLLACVAAALALELATRSPRITGWLARNGSALGRGAGVVVLAVALVLASRPLWMQAHWFEPGSSYAQYIETHQREAGVTVDGTRSYDEMTVTWLSWYLGIATVVLGVLGAAMLARRAVGRRRPEVLAFLVTLGVPSLLYLVLPRITPDHVWAMRRLLPIAMPMTLLCAAWVLAVLWGASGTWRARAAVVGLVAIVLLFPVWTWGSLFTTVEYGGRRGEVTALCDAVAGRPVVVARPDGPPLLPTLRVMCDTDVIEVSGPATASTLAAARGAWAVDEVLVASFVEDAIPWSGSVPDPLTSTPMQRWPNGIHRPGGRIQYTSRLWLGLIGPTGSAVPLPPADRPE